jgi:ATP-dependent RNA helicase DDX49/DBP8
MEVIVQARWIQSFDEQVQALLRDDCDLSLTKARMIALADASKDFGWSLKELRNRM